MAGRPGGVPPYSPGWPAHPKVAKCPRIAELEELSGSCPPAEEENSGYFSLRVKVKRHYKALAGSGRANTANNPIPFNWFGSVIVGREPVNCSQLCEGILQEQYIQLCDLVLHISKNSHLCKNSNVQNVIINVLPRLAAANREKFVSLYLDYILNTAVHDRDPLSI